MSQGSRTDRGRRRFLQALGASAVLTSQVPSSASSAQSTSPTTSRASGPVRIGVVGGGFGRYFQWHLHPDCQVVAVCDIREDRLELLKQTYQANDGYAEYDEFLKHPTLDAVAVFTPAHLHAEMVVAALKMGKHVISAVPTGLSESELEMILDAVQRTGLKYMLAETSRYRPETLTCIDWAKDGKFGNLFYSEAEYHHTGLAPYAWGTSFDCQSCEFISDIDKVDRQNVREGLVPTWSHGYPPMLYPDHCTGFIVPVTGERLVEVTAYGWGDNQEMLKENYYNDNPFLHTVGLYKTSKGNSCRISIGWHIAHPVVERASFYGDRMSYVMENGACDQSMVYRQIDAPPWGIHGGEVKSVAYQANDHRERLPASLRIDTGHGGSHSFITHEFISAIIEDRHPETNIWEAINYTLPGIVAHESALRGGTPMKIRDYGTPN